jgi:hypothetical protein
MTDQVSTIITKELFGNIPSAFNLHDNQRWLFEFADYLRLLEQEGSLSETNAKLGLDLWTRLSGRLANGAEVHAPVELRAPKERATRKKRSKGGHKLTAHRVIITEVDPRIFTDRSALVPKLKVDPGFTGWIDLENAGTIQGYTTATSNRVWYKLAEIMPALKAADLLR